MKENFKSNYENLLLEVDTFKQKILYEFVDTAKNFYQELLILDENKGIDENRHIALECATTDCQYSILNYNLFYLSKSVFSKIFSDEIINAIEAFESFYKLVNRKDFSTLLKYEQIEDLIKLSEYYDHTVAAEKHLMQIN